VCGFGCCCARSGWMMDGRKRFKEACGETCDSTCLREISEMAGTISEQPLCHNVCNRVFCRAKTAQCCLSVSECQICARYAFWNLTHVRKALRGGLQVAAAISEQVWLLLTCQVKSTFPPRVIGGRIRRRQRAD
jgi:hypothetical protein